MSKNRREFLRNATQLAAGLGLTAIPGTGIANHLFHRDKTMAVYTGNDYVRVGLIGCKNMGWADLASLLKNNGVECLALCDVDSNVLNSRASEFESKWKQKPMLYNDYRKLLENKDIDAVIIGTPDHWHCLQMIHACEAGKDVYVEKPIANTIEECNLMVAAAKKYNRVVQVGQWQRSDPHWLGALDYLHSGKLGKIRNAKTWAFVNYGKDFPAKPDEPVPSGVDYDRWLGPAPKRPFNPNRFHGNFRYFWDYGGGLMTDWGVHMIDMVLAGMNVSAPNSVAAIGGKYGYPDSAAETPDSLQAVYDFGDFSMVWEQSLGTGRGPYNRTSGNPGVAFIGNNGTLVIDRDTWEVIPEINNGNYMLEAFPVQANKPHGLDSHTLNWLECIRSRKQPNCTIEMGRDAAINAQLGNISYRTGTKVYWDKTSNTISNDVKAAQLTKAHYNSPWKLPKL
jgi:predicted dehydrogenase